MLVFSTILHFFSILPLIKYYTHTSGYIIIISLSTSFSILYHLTGESNKIITIIDYSFATIWGIYDIYFGYRYRNDLYKFILGNTVVFFLNIQIPYDDNYRLYHSIWHLINAIKCYYIASLINHNLERLF